jgi:hypothetical protein
MQQERPARMRVKVIWLCGLLAACSSGTTAPPGGVYEVPQGGTASSAGGGDFASTIEGALAEPTADGLPAHYPGATLPASADGTGPALDDDRINLMQWTLEQQKIDAAVAQEQLDAARSQLVIVQPGRLPNRVDGVNVALYAQQSSNGLGERAYDRTVGARVAGVGACGRHRDPDAAQRAFLAAGGPEGDRLGLDPDGDGFACSFDPAPYRALR